ncbi:beta-ketoacyl-ACP synthase III [Streptomyces sp. NPDC023838]|uniref:beta-ketoacyl-ACP synthase III n=1 Tax=Streptomyces sp. NPDC023838 TaxID=3154325 RepID=UPI0033E8AA2C
MTVAEVICDSPIRGHGRERKPFDLPEEHVMTSSISSVVCGIGAYVPPRVVRNDDPAFSALDTSDEWIRSRTGIIERRWADPGTSTGDLAVRAAERALLNAGDRGVDLVIVTTTTPDHRTPSTAPAVAAQLGLGTVPAFDLGAACGGFLYGLATADVWIRSGAVERVLLIGADTLTTFIDPTDRSTAVIFADGAGAVVLRHGEGTEPGAVHRVRLGSDGALKDLVIVPAGGSRAPDPEVTEGRRRHSVNMQGKQLFQHAVSRMTESSRAVLQDMQWSADSVQAFIGHQANQRILSKVADLVGVSEESRFGNISRVGNTSSASIPLVMNEIDMQPGSKTLLTTFGGGAVWGSAALSWPILTPRKGN